MKVSNYVLVMCVSICALFLGMNSVNAEPPIYVTAELDGKQCSVQSDWLNMRPIGMLKVHVSSAIESESTMTYRLFKEGEDTPMMEGKVLKGEEITQFISVESGRYSISIACDQLEGSPACKGIARLTWHLK